MDNEVIVNLSYAIEKLTESVDNTRPDPIGQAFNERAQIRKRWPNLPSGISANESFQINKSALGYEPQKIDLIHALKPIPRDGAFTALEAAQYLKEPVHHVAALLYFADLCFLVFRVKKDTYQFSHDLTQQAKGKY
jgi:hypothetical protein